MWRMLFLGVAPALVAGTGPTIGSDGVLHTQVLGAGHRTQHSNSFYALTSDGSAKWIFDANATLGPHAEGWNNTVYVTTQGNSTDSEFPAALFALDSLDGSIKWKYQVDGNRWIENIFPLLYHYNPLVVATDGTVYLTSLTERVYGLKLDAIDTAGELMWTVNLINDTDSFSSLQLLGLSAIGADGTLYVTKKNSFDALEPTTGTVKWSAAVDAYHYQVLTTESNVFILEIYGNHSVLSSLSNEDGSVRWNRSLSTCSQETCDYYVAEWMKWMVLGSNNELYVNGMTVGDGTCSLRVFDFNANDLRNFPCLSGMWDDGNPRYSSQEDLFITVGDDVLARRGTDGQLLWNVSLTDHKVKEEAKFGENGMIFVGSADCATDFSECDGDSHDSTLYAIRHGKLAWSVQTGGPVYQVMSEDGTTYVQGWLCPEPLRAHPHPPQPHPFPHPPPHPHPIDCLSGPPALEVIAVDADGVEKWRYTPTEAVAEYV